MSGEDAVATTTRPGSRDTTVTTPGDALFTAARRLLDLITGNKALSLLIYVGFVFLKVLAVSAWRLPTALGVLNVSSLPAVFAGATLSALPTIFVAALSIILYAWIAGYWRGRWGAPTTRSSTPTGRVRDWARFNGSFVWTIVSLLVAVLILAPWQFAVVGVAVAAAFGLFAGAWTRLTGRPGIRQVLLVVVLAVLAALSYSQFVSAVWIPHEDLLTQDGTHRVGYVLGDDDGQTTLLQSHTRLLVIVPDTQVTHRQVCAIKGGYHSTGTSVATTDSVLLLILGRDAVPECSQS
jgi:hypothetical protein